MHIPAHVAAAWSRARNIVLVCAVALSVVAVDGAVARSQAANLLAPDAASLEGSLGGWFGLGNTVIELDTAHVHGGMASVRITVDPSGAYPDGTGTARAGTIPLIGAPRVVPGRPYSGYLYIQGEQASRVRCEIRFYLADGAVLSDRYGELNGLPAGRWSRLDCGGVAPEHAAFVGIRVYAEGVATGDVFRADDAFVTEGVLPETPASESTPGEAAGSPSQDDGAGSAASSGGSGDPGSTESAAGPDGRVSRSLTQWEAGQASTTVSGTPWGTAVWMGAGTSTARAKSETVDAEAGSIQSARVKVQAVSSFAIANCGIVWLTAGDASTSQAPGNYLILTPWLPTSLQCAGTAPASVAALHVTVDIGPMVGKPPHLITESTLVSRPAASPEEPPAADSSPPDSTTSTTTTTSPVVTTTTTTAPQPPGPSESSGDWPSARSTGVPAFLVLTKSGPVTVQEPGTLIEGLDIEGTLVIDAPNVTVRRSRISTNSTHGIFVTRNGSGAIIEDVEVDGRGIADAAVAGWGFTVRRANLHGSFDGVKLADDTRVEDSYIHSLASAPGAHNDGVQAQEGSNMVLRHNAIVNQHTQTSAVLIAPDTGPIQNVLIEDNFLDGGGYTVYAFGSNITVKNNVFGTKGYYGPVYPSTEGVWIGNTWDDTGGAVRPPG